MNNIKKSIMREEHKLLVLCAVLFLALVGMIVSLHLTGEVRKGEFIKPEFDKAAVSGTPTVDEKLAYQEVYTDGMAYRPSMCCVPTMEQDELTVYFTSNENNEKYLKLRILDEDGHILGETGLLKPGEYVKSVKLTEELEAGTKLKLKVMGYEPDDYTSAGSISVNVTIGGTE